MKFVYRISNLCVLFVCMLNSYSKLETAKINSAQLHKLQNTTTTVRYNCYKWKEIAINVKASRPPAPYIICTLKGWLFHYADKQLLMILLFTN